MVLFLLFNICAKSDKNSVWERQEICSSATQLAAPLLSGRSRIWWQYKGKICEVVCVNCLCLSHRDWALVRAPVGAACFVSTLPQTMVSGLYWLHLIFICPAPVEGIREEVAPVCSWPFLSGGSSLVHFQWCPGANEHMCSVTKHVARHVGQNRETGKLAVHTPHSDVRS